MSTAERSSRHRTGGTPRVLALDRSPVRGFEPVVVANDPLPPPPVPVVPRRMYANWTDRHEFLAQGRFAKVKDLRRVLLACQHIDFHVHSVRDDTRGAILEVMTEAPFSKTVRYPDAAWVECSDTICGTLLERMLSALAFGGSGSENPVNGRDSYSDAKVSFAKARQELMKKLTSRSTAIAAVDGVYASQQVFETHFSLNWQ